MKDSARYAELFLTESRDNLVAVNEALLRLERDARDSEAIDAAFRAVHTIKGMAGVMGYGAVADLAHDMEALLAGARDEQRSEEHTSELQSQSNLVCRLLLEKKNKNS